MWNRHNSSATRKETSKYDASFWWRKAFTAIALLFAILKINPAPFCVLDEIEAALDDVNVYRFAEYLKKFSSNTQFLVITHRKGTMEAADTVYGVTMEESGISKLLSMSLKK